MANFNQIILVGNMTRDPEMRYTPQGTAICQGGIAVNRKWNDSQSGEQREEVMFIDFTVWSKAAENFSQYVRKGHLVMITGRLKLESWEDKQTGARRSKHIVQVDSFQFLPNKDRNDDEGVQSDGSLPPPGRGGKAPYNPRNTTQQTAPVRHDAQSPAEPPEDDDVPF